jgi:site-specific recombinase XerD
MIGKNFSLLFFLKKPKKYSAGNVPIYIRITVEGNSREMTTSRKCDPNFWDQKAEKAIGKTEYINELNHHLSTLKVKVFEARISLIESNKPVTADNIKNMLTGKVEKSKTILEVFKNHNDQMAALVNSQYAPLTIERYNTSLRHTRSFIKWKYNHDDLEIHKLDYEFIAGYEFWFKSVRKCNHNTTMKYIRNFRKIINECIKRGWLTQDPFARFKMSIHEVKITPLSKIELKAISDKTFEIERLEQVKDIFLFCCYTGLAYADIKKLKRTDISLGVDGQRWIFTSRQKTDTASRIPLLPFAQIIMEKYNDNIKCINVNSLLPVLSNQKMNAYLKEIADVCGITKRLTFHIARHTFATTVTLSNGVPIETVSRMLGHRNLKTTQHYAKILDMKVSEDMMQLKKKLKSEL